MYADVVVLTYQAPGIGFFTYEIPKDLAREIKIGQLVQVPFGKRTPLGLVLEPRIKNLNSRIKVKPIISIVFSQPLLLPYQIKLLKWMANYYHAPYVNCLEAMLPTKALNTKRLMTNAKTISQSVSRSSLVASQTIVLVPTINRIPETLATFPHAKSYSLYHNQLKTAERFSVWLKILSGSCDFIFGSRSAIFAPCPNLSKIFIYDEHDSTYKDERSPYFDTLTVAEKLKELTGAQLQIIDSSPKITTYFIHRKEIQKPPPSTSRPKVKIVSMLAEKAAGNRLPISDVLATHLRQTQKTQGQVLLFLNKKIESGHIYCKNCKHSQFIKTQPEICPNCQSPDIWFNSLNIHTLATQVKGVVPDTNIRFIAEGLNQQPALRAGRPKTKNSSSLSGSTELTIEVLRVEDLRAEGQKPDIDIATASVFYALTPTKYDLVAHIATDSALTASDFSSAEKTYAQITDLKNLCKGILILQTYNPDNLVIKSAATENYLQVYRSQIAERKALSYPPFVLLVKLTLKGKNENLIEEKSQKLAQDLSQLPVESYQSKVTVLGPYKPSFTKTTTSYNIILKTTIKNYDLTTRQSAVEKILTRYLSYVTCDWQIVVEPNTLN